MNIFNSMLTLNLTTENYSSWVWKVVPHYRAIEDYPDSEEEEETTEEIYEKYEYRDEANRPWWKFFDEYEYRFNRKTRERQEWWRWYEKGTPDIEKRLVMKLDFLITFFSFMSFWAKNLDSSNLSNAYVSGMKEEIHMMGNDYANANSLASAGSVIFQVFYMYLFPRIPIHYLFVFGDACWSIITIFSGFIENPSQLNATRFLIGAVSSSYFVSVHYLLGSVGMNVPRHSLVKAE